MSTWPEVLATLVARTDLSAEQTAWAMGEILAGEATPAQVAGFAIGLKAKGETVEEVSGLAEAMYAARTRIDVPGRLLDVVGTGGDRSMSVNISTMAAIVAAGAGAKVVKHGNRSASSQSGSADVLEALGIRLDLPPGRVAEVVEETGITFCFAAAFNPAMRHTAAPRRELGIGTTFNILGPLANPTRPAAQAVGCADARMAPVMAGVFAARPARRRRDPQRRGGSPGARRGAGPRARRRRAQCRCCPRRLRPARRARRRGPLRGRRPCPPSGRLRCGCRHPRPVGGRRRLIPRRDAAFASGCPLARGAGCVRLADGHREQWETSPPRAQWPADRVVSPPNGAVRL
jgi:hypothetical protein